MCGCGSAIVGGTAENNDCGKGLLLMQPLLLLLLLLLLLVWTGSNTLPWLGVDGACLFGGATADRRWVRGRNAVPVLPWLLFGAPTLT